MEVFSTVLKRFTLIMEREEVLEILKFCVWLLFFAAMEVVCTEDILPICCEGGGPGVLDLVTCFAAMEVYSTEENYRERRVLEFAKL